MDISTLQTGLALAPPARIPVNHDQGFKLLLSAYFPEFLELFVPDVRAYTDPDSLSFPDKEVFADLPDVQRRGRSARQFCEFCALPGASESSWCISSTRPSTLCPPARTSRTRRLSPGPVVRFQVDFPPLASPVQVIQLMKSCDYVGRPNPVEPACCPSWAGVGASGRK